MSAEGVSPADGVLFNRRPRSPIRVSAEQLVSAQTLSHGPLPLVLTPAEPTVSLLAWLEQARARVDRQLLEHGGVLFRGFALRDETDFAAAARAMATSLLEYGERSSPRTRLGAGVYTSTEHPATESILLHTEQSYTLNWPMKIMFFCIQPSLSGGRTPIADTRRILRRLPASVVEAFRTKQVRYVRNFGEGLGLSWEETFQTTDRAVVEAHCRQMAIDCIWRDGNRLRTSQVRPAIRRHPVTGEEVWFNHAAFFHFSSLPASVRDAILQVVDLDDVAYNTFYGDGSPIEPEVVETVRAAYRDETVSFEWQRGDLLVLDNMLSAHGREPFEGPRRVAVAMADPVPAAVAVSNAGAAL